MNWTFDKEDLKYDVVAPGDYRCRIEKAEEAVSKNGKPMIKLELAISGTTNKAWYYLVFPSPSDPKFMELKKYTNKNIDSIRDSFDIPDKDILQSLNINTWVGKVGACRIKNEADNTGQLSTKVSYFIRRDKQAELPAWKEPSNSGAKAAATPIMPKELANAGLDDLFPSDGMSLQGEM